MRTTINTFGNKSPNRITLNFIEKYLKDSGLDIKREGNTFYADLVQERDMLIGLKKGKFSIAVALPVNEEDMKKVSIVANISMDSTMMTKVFLLPGEERMNIWFVVEAFCKTQSQFVEHFAPTFKQLLGSVRTYIKVREEIEKREGGL